MLRAFKFSKPKGPGFGISKGFYMSVLSTKAVMPALWDVLNPERIGGAVEGLGAPLTPGQPKEVVHQPMERGAYVFATRDRKTVLKVLVLSKEEAGFDPEALIKSQAALNIDPDIIAGIRATWSIAQANFESYDPDVYPALLFLFRIVRRVAELTDGVIADPLSQRYLLPHELLRPTTNESATNVFDVAAFGTSIRPDGMHAYTLGLQKLALPELEITGLAPDVSRIAGEFLLSAAQSELDGNVISSGMKLGAADALFEAREGGHDRALWEGIDVMELLPPTHMTATDALEIWAKQRES